MSYTREGLDAKRVPFLLLQRGRPLWFDEADTSAALVSVSDSRAEAGTARITRISSRKSLRSVRGYKLRRITSHAG